MPFTDPGRMFTEQFGEATCCDDILHYAAFLRRESGLTTAPPIVLTKIYEHFGIPSPTRKPLPNLQGLLANPEYGIILINENDIPSRQRFTEAHELIEFLFVALHPGGGWAARQRVGVFRQEVKETLCNEGAAELLMPRDSFDLYVRQRGMSYGTARDLAAIYQVSVTASLFQMVRVGPGRHAIVLWRMKNKPSETRELPPADQLPLFAMPEPERSSPKLRVEWSFRGPGVSHIPKDKSIPPDSTIYRAWTDGVFTSGTDYLDMGGLSGTFRCENHPLEIEGQRHVLSLLHVPGDTGCIHREST
jgi:hypothetical protein